MSDLKKEFWDRIEDVQAGMLGFRHDDRLVPMSPQADDDEPGAIWFITAQGTDLVNGVQGGPQSARFVVADAKEGLWADVDGTLELSHDTAKLDKHWNAFAAAWFDEGREDPDIRLLKFTPSKAEVSISPNGFKFLYEVAKANLTGETADAGEQGVITF